LSIYYHSTSVLQLSFSDKSLIAGASNTERCNEVRNVDFFVEIEPRQPLIICGRKPVENLVGIRRFKRTKNRHRARYSLFQSLNSRKCGMVRNQKRWNGSEL